jgi:intracellular multiplication protein IcmP
VFVLWWAGHTKVATVVLALRSLEVWIISFFTPELDALRGWIKAIDRRVVTLGDLFQVSTMTGRYTRWVTTPILMWMGWKLYKSSPTERFKRRFTDRSLPKVEAGLYPWIKISLKHDFAAMDPDEGPWALAQTERQFARQHRLRDEQGAIDRDKTEAVFVRQVGNLFSGYGAMRSHRRALFALFVARIARDFHAADDLLKRLASSAAEGKLDMTGVDELARKHGNDKKVKRAMRQHAYETTLLMTLLELARGGARGKDYLPPNWFLWLKGMDRGLWYALADVDRKTPHVECAGVFAHWLAERARGKRLEMPFVKTAVEGLIIEIAKFTDNAEDEGISEDDEDIVIAPAPALPLIPSPEQAAASRAAKQSAGAKSNPPSDDE